jgi:hypothetical protein
LVMINDHTVLVWTCKPKKAGCKPRQGGTIDDYAYRP